MEWSLLPPSLPSKLGHEDARSCRKKKNSMSYKGYKLGDRNGQDINGSQELPKETWKHTWCNTNLWMVHLNWASVDGRRKDERSHPPVMSPGRCGMSRQAAKVKPGTEPPPQDPCGRFQGTGARSP